MKNELEAKMEINIDLMSLASRDLSKCQRFRTVLSYWKNENVTLSLTVEIVRFRPPLLFIFFSLKKYLCFSYLIIFCLSFPRFHHVNWFICSVGQQLNLARNCHRNIIVAITVDLFHFKFFFFLFQSRYSFASIVYWLLKVM